MLEAGRVVMIAFPFSDLSTSKRRPVVLLTAPDSLGDFICMAITSKSHHGRSVTITPKDFAVGKLPVASFVRADKVYTLSAALVDHEVGNLKREVVLQAIAILCGVVRPDA